MMEAREAAWSVRAATGVAGILLACLWSACAAHDAPLGMGAAGGAAPAEVASGNGVHPRYEPGDGSLLALGSMPWPDDLYLDRTGHIAVNGFFEVGDAANEPRLTAALKDLDGFGVSTPVYFYFDGLLDHSSLPADEEASLTAQASVFLIDADTGSPDAFQKQPIVVDWQSGPRRLALRPADGHPLTPGRRYAAVLTRRVKDTRGNSIEPAAKFAAVRDPDQQLTDARLSAARAEYTPVLETLVKSGLPRQDICGLAVFHVQNVDRDLSDARRLVRSGKAPVLALGELVGPTQMDDRLGRVSSGASAGFETSGAAPHDSLYAMVHGTLPSSNLLSATARTHGAFERDEAGQLRVKRTEDVPFTLFLPRSALKAPIVIYQHQRDRERSDALAIANELASRGLAVLAIDAPFQGMRASTPPRRNSVDWRNRFTGKENAPDGFGDAPGDFLGFDSASAAGVAWQPFDARDATRQTVVDLMVAVRAIEEGSLQKFTAAQAALKDRTFVTTSIGFIGEDTGASIGMMLARFEPTLQAVVLAAPGGATINQWAWSATDEPLFATLTSDIGYNERASDRTLSDPGFWPDLAIYQTLLDRADPLAHVAALRRAAVNVLVLMAEDDETVPNRSTEAYSAALGTTLVGSDPRYVYDLMREDLRDEGWSGNYQTAGSWVTRTTYVYSPATHDFLQSRIDQQRYAHPPEPPFELLPQHVAVQNPTAAAATQIGQYLESFFACVDSGGALPAGACPASPD